MKNKQFKYGKSNMYKGTYILVVSNDDLEDYNLKDINIEYFDNYIVVIAKECIFKITLDKLYVDKMQVRPAEEDIQKTWFRKREFVLGFYNTNTYEDYKIETNNYTIKYL